MDLITINILRARDHGVQPYNDLRWVTVTDRVSTFDLESSAA